MTTTLKASIPPNLVVILLRESSLPDAISNPFPIASSNELQLIAAGRNLSVPLTSEYIEVAITLLQTLKNELSENEALITDNVESIDPSSETGFFEVSPRSAAQIEMGDTDQLDI